MPTPGSGPGPRVALALVVLALPLAAQSADKLAIQALKSGQAGQLKTFKVELKGHDQTVASELKQFTQLLASGSSPFTVGVLAAQAVADYQAAVAESVTTSMQFQQLVAQSALANHIEAPWDANLPAGFSLGEGGLADGFRSAVESLVSKSYAKLDKRLAKLAAAAAKHDWVYAWQLRAPQRPYVYIWGDSPAGQPDAVPVSLDLVLSISGVSEGKFLSLINVAGSADPSGGDLSVVVSGAADSVDFAELDENGRYLWSLTNGGDFFPPGNYLVAISQPPDLAETREQISIR